MFPWHSLFGGCAKATNPKWNPVWEVGIWEVGTWKIKAWQGAIWFPSNFTFIYCILLGRVLPWVPLGVQTRFVWVMSDCLSCSFLFSWPSRVVSTFRTSCSSCSTIMKTDFVSLEVLNVQKWTRAFRNILKTRAGMMMSEHFCADLPFKCWWRPQSSNPRHHEVKRVEGTLNVTYNTKQGSPLFKGYLINHAICCCKIY